MSGIVLLDNHDSFVYNLVDALRHMSPAVFRNTIPVDRVLASTPDLIVLSPGPGYPADAGTMMQLIGATQGRIPILGICLGFQGLIEHFGGRVKPCGPVHGASISMQVEPSGMELFGMTSRDVPVARYHSLGAADPPPGMHALARTDTELGSVVMAARSDDGMSIGLQFHPESILTPAGPLIIERCVEELLKGNN